MPETPQWPMIGTVVGDATTAEFSFILRSFRSRIGDIVAVPMQVPNDNYSGQANVIAWGRVSSIERFNPFFPYEAAQELAAQSLSADDTVLSTSRDQLQARVLVLGFSNGTSGNSLDLYPLTYPIPPAAGVCFPPDETVRKLLSGDTGSDARLNIGTLISRPEIALDISANKIAARHLAILAMTGGGKTVAARRILRELIALRYPILIFDPHGDYLGRWEKRAKFPGTKVNLFYPHIMLSPENRELIQLLVAKMTQGLSEPQQEVMGWLLEQVPPPKGGGEVLKYLATLRLVATRILEKGKAEKRGRPTAGIWRIR